MGFIKYLFIFLCIISFVFLVSAETEWDSHLNKLIEDQGVLSGDVTNISELDKENLPKDIIISNVDENNVGIYDVDYFDGISNKTIYVVSFATQEIEESPIGKIENYEYLAFSGNSGEIGEFLVLDDGSIVGLSSVVDYSGSGEIFVEVYVNSELMFISNEILSSGDSFDYDIQSIGIDDFSFGDFISVKVISTESISIEEVKTIVKIKI